MPTLQLVKEALKALKDRNGSSVVAITKWIENEKKVGKITLPTVFIVDAARMEHIKLVYLVSSAYNNRCFG